MHYESSACVRPIVGRYVFMSRKPDPELIDDDSPEWTEADFKQAKRLKDMPASFQQAIQRVRGPQKAPVKIQTTIRFDPDVLKGLKATGRGWQTRATLVMQVIRSEEHTSELQSLMRNSYAVFCLKKK